MADFLEALELEGVTLVGNDTGGAICQLVAVKHPERIARLVLTPCDAYEHFPPPAFKALATIGRSPAALWGIAQLMRPAFARRLPNGYGGITRRADDALTASWVRPIRVNRGDPPADRPGVRGDAARAHARGGPALRGALDPGAARLGAGRPLLQARRTPNGWPPRFPARASS